MPFDVRRMVYGGFKTLVEVRPGASARAPRRPAARPRRNGHARPLEAQPAAH
jgi:hypothetical protein